LGKHSNIIFTQNTNTGEGLEENILKENDNLTDCLLSNTGLNEMSNNRK